MREVNAPESGSLVDSIKAEESLYLAKHTTQRLTELATQQLDIRQRFELLNFYREQVASITESVRNLFSTLSDQSQCVNLETEMMRMFSRQAAGYKMIVYSPDVVSRANNSDELKSILQSSTYWAIRYHSLSLLCAFSGYRRYPAGVWRELHWLYRHACVHEVEGIEISADSSADSDGADTVHAAYLRTILLGLIDPFKLPKGTLHQVYSWLLLWADEAELLVPSKVIDTQAGFVIDCELDRPGVIQRSGQGGLIDRRHWLLNCKPLDGLISGQLKTPKRPGDLSMTENRIGMRRWRRAMLIIHRQLLKNPFRKTERLKENKSVTVSLLDLTTDQHQQDDVMITDSIDAQIIDISTTGMRLVVSADNQIITGQLLKIGLCETPSNSTTEHSMGVVKWRKYNDHSQLILGVKLLGEIKQHIELLDSGSDSSEKIKAVIVDNPNINSDDGPIVCVTAGYKRNCLFATTDTENPITWRLVDRVEAADSADCYRVKVYE